jgi:hypothetical protein
VQITSFNPSAFLIAYLFFWLAVLGLLLARDDLEAVEKLMWVIVVIFVPLFGTVFYLTLSRRPVRSVRRKIDPNNQLSGTPWENNPGHTNRPGV